MANQLMNKYSSQKLDAVAICKNCLNTPVQAGISVVAFKISYVCRCGELVRIEHNSNSFAKRNGIPALTDGNKLFCPMCSSLLFEVDRKSIGGLSFRAKCACGEVVQRQRAPLKHPRKIGVYASLDDAQDK